MARGSFDEAGSTRCAPVTPYRVPPTARISQVGGARNCDRRSEASRLPEADGGWRRRNSGGAGQRAFGIGRRPAGRDRARRLRQRTRRRCLHFLQPARRRGGWRCASPGRTTWNQNAALLLPPASGHPARPNRARARDRVRFALRAACLAEHRARPTSSTPSVSTSKCMCPARIQRTSQPHRRPHDILAHENITKHTHAETHQQSHFN